MASSAAGWGTGYRTDQAGSTASTELVHTSSYWLEHSEEYADTQPVRVIAEQFVRRARDGAVAAAGGGHDVHDWPQ